jgi:hypothetical protein
MVAVRLDPAVWQGVEPDTEALLDTWLVEEGAAVNEGDPIAVVVLVKTTFDVLVPKDGTFGRHQDLAVIE